MQPKFQDLPPHSNILGHQLFHPHKQILEPYVDFNGIKIHHSIVAIICRILHRESLFLYRRQEL